MNLKFFLNLFLIIQLFVSITCTQKSIKARKNQQRKNKIINDLKRKANIRYHLKWISKKTQFPISFEKPLEESDVNEFDWYKYDSQDFVTNLQNYKPDYYVSHEPLKSKLMFFNYDFISHDQLSTYEPRPIKNLNGINRHYTQDLFSLIYLKSHRIQISREQEQVNVTCIADFIVDKNSIDTNSLLVDQMKQLALFKLRIKDAKKSGYKSNSIYEKTKYKNKLERLSDFYKANSNSFAYSQSPKSKYPPAFSRLRLISRDTNKLESKRIKSENLKSLVNIRLSFGPVKVQKPFNSQFISCGLDLINADDVNLDYHASVYKYLTNENEGYDKNNDQDYEDLENSTPIIIPLPTSTISSLPTTEASIKETTTQTSTQENVIEAKSKNNEEDFNENSLIKNSIIDFLNNTGNFIKNSENQDDLTKLFNVFEEDSQKKDPNVKMFEENENTLVVKDPKSNFVFLVDKPSSKNEERKEASRLENNSNIIKFNYGILVIAFLSLIINF